MSCAECGGCSPSVDVDCTTNTVYVTGCGTPTVIVSTNGVQGPAGPEGPVGPTGPQGPAGSAIVDIGSWGSPVTISSAITIPVNLRARIFIQGSPGGTLYPTFGNGTATQELYIVCVSNTDFVLTGVQSNVIVSGDYEMGKYSEQYFQWNAGANSWLESGRNEITRGQYV